MAGASGRSDMSEVAPTDQRSLITPEGIDLRVRLGGVSERGLALIIDLVIIVAILIGMIFAASAALSAAQIEETGAFVYIFVMLTFFILRNFYFTLFECGRRAATPGKRVMGLRVVARDGSALRVDSVVARNTMRELEVYLPMTFLFSAGDQVQAWIVLSGIVWCGVFVFLPVFNRDRLRAGDLIAGTWVLKTPKQPLLPDLAGEPVLSAAYFNFTIAQLDVYGVKELQVLESVLRLKEAAAMEAVAERIRFKIGWRKGAAESDEEFLRAYYGALRLRLEQRLLFGKRKRDKHDTSV